jgi:hypothetical protein
MSSCRNFGDATLRSAPFAFICVAMILFVATAAQAACDDRPGTPVWRIPGWNSATSIHLSWINKATESPIWWDLEISDGSGNVLSSQAGIQPIGTGFNQNLSMDLNVPLGAQRCYRLKARTEPGTEGCVSIQWTNKICVDDAGAGASFRLGDRITLESFNHVGDFVRHRAFLGELTAINQADLVDRQDATFIVRPGLNGARRESLNFDFSVSFESVNFPGWFLRHQDFRLKLMQNDNSPLFNDDASFFPSLPLTRRGFSLSFEATKLPGSFIRHRDFHLWLDQNDNSNLFAGDATFFVIPGLDR